MFKYIKNKLFAQNMDFRIRIFNLLAATGFIVSLVIFAVSLINGASALKPREPPGWRCKLHNKHSGYFVVLHA